MRTRTLIAIALLSFGASTGRAQQPVGPIAPAAPTLSKYDKTLSDLLKADADDKLWTRLTPEARARILDDAAALTANIQGLPVGPVAPKPPKPRPHNANPSQRDFDATLKQLRGALGTKSRVQPDYRPPAETARPLQSLLDQLSTAEGH